MFAVIDAWVFSTQNRTIDTAGVQLFLGAFYLNFTLLGAWSALYYAINFFLTIEEQADQLQRLENQASSAQLAMLRYQLNPHFLFNTLNSISTLVLLKQTERLTPCFPACRPSCDIRSSTNPRRKLRWSRRWRR